MIKLIGFHGKAGSGKDTAYDLLSTRLDMPVARDAFADRLKISFARLFLHCPTADGEGWSDEECIAFANHFKANGKLEVPDFPGGTIPDGSKIHRWNIGRLTGREALQRYGTESHRHVFRDDFWINAVLPDLDDPLSFGRKDDKPWSLLVVTDVRFPNEAKAIREAGGVVWHIIRPELEVGVQDSHLSEQPLDDDLVDRTIINDGTLEDFSDELYEAWVNVHVPTTYEAV